MKTHVIIGAAAAGIGCLNTLIKLDPNSRIICISDEKENPYNKCFLADYLKKVKQSDELNIVRADILNHSNLTFMLATRVTVINPQEKTISLHDNRVIPYDTLFIGTGSSPIKPAIAGLIDGEGVFTFHTIADANKIMAYAKDHEVNRVMVIGAGLSGLECADSLRAWGMEVTVIERGERVLARQVDQEGAKFIAKCMQDASVELRCNEMVQEIVHQNGTMFVIAAGLKPNGALAQQAGLAMQDGYIQVDEFMQTSNPHIFAGGDCVKVFDQVTKQLVPSCTWPDAMQQGSVAAHGMVGVKKAYPGACVITSSAFFGKTFVTAGTVVNVPEDWRVQVTRGDDFYHKLVFHEGKLKGYLLIGNTQIASKLRRALLTQECVN